MPPGAVIPEGALIGIKSKPPANERAGAGRHLVRLAGDQAADAPEGRHRPNWTYEPSTLKKIWRAVFEALHTSFPSMLFITFAILSIDNFF